MVNDKNQAIIDYLNQCDAVRNTPLFFNFANAKNNDVQIVAEGNDISLNSKFVDGSVLKQYTFNLLVYKAISYDPVVAVAGYPNENVDDVFEVQAILDWVNAQNDAENFPDFGYDCVVDSIEALTTNPAMNGVNASVNPPLATYNITIRITYLDKSKAIWNK